MQKCIGFITCMCWFLSASAYVCVKGVCVLAYTRVLMHWTCSCVSVCCMFVYSLGFWCVCVHYACWDVAALSAMSGTASLRVAAGENDDDEIKILRPAEGAAAISLAAVRIDLFQHLTFNHDKTVGKLIVLQDIRHQSPLILSGAPRCMNTNRLSRQPSHPLLPSLFLLSFLSLIPRLFWLFSWSLQIFSALLFLYFPISHCLFLSQISPLVSGGFISQSLPTKKLTTKLVLFYLSFHS